MDHEHIRFSRASTDFYFNGKHGQLRKLAPPATSVLVTDENIFAAHGGKFKGYDMIVLKPGEEFKVQETVDEVIAQLIDMKADRQTTLVGVGGGVVTDLTGYVASVYMRGIRFGFMPTSILALVDASIGGKNGIDVGLYKNMVGSITQPAFLLHDMSLLASLPQHEWVNGFAEIIKHACILDRKMFLELESHDLAAYQSHQKRLGELIRRNALLKARIVKKDEFEKKERRLLNFGHTLGHALETQYELSHGEAISIGMTCAMQLSEQLADFKQTERVVEVLTRYGLPTYAEFDKTAAIEVLRMDKKRERKEMNYILLDRIGKGIIQSIPMKKLESLIMAM